jgi:hypoxanthine phosphoribosyltransferase
VTKRCELDGNLSDRRAVMERLARDLGFPMGPPPNLDALYDVLRTDIAGPIEIVWRETARARAQLGDDFERLLHVLREVAAERPDVSLRLEAAGEEAGPLITPLFAAGAIASRVGQLAEHIARTLPEPFTVVGLLKGAFVLTADLVRALDAVGRRPQVEFLQVSSYGAGTESRGTVKVIGEMPGSIGGRNVLLVDDIQDTGRTLAFTRDMLVEHGAARVWTCVLLDKPSRRVVAIEPDFTGFVIPDVFVVGYGIDYGERYRHLPFLGRFG